MAEKEYIEREALINVCKEIIQDKWNEKACPVSWSHAYADFIDDIEEQPVADVIPVVRCKDCIYRGREDCAMFYRCNCGEQHTWETDNDFCSYGERKEYGNG